jgi:hypothetical protein
VVGQRIAAATRIVAALLLSGVAALATAQPVIVPRKVLVYFEPGPAGGMTRADAIFLYETMLARLQRGPFVVLEPAEVALPPERAVRSVHATRRGADGWIHVAVEGRNDDVVATVSAFDVAGDTAPFAPTTFTIPRDAVQRAGGWDGVVDLVASAFPSSEQRVQGEVSRTSEIMVTALAGTTVRGLSAAPLVVGPDGTARAEVLLPGLFVIEAVRPGSLRARMERYLTVGETQLAIPQTPIPRLFYEASVLNLGYFGASIAEVAGPLYLRAGFTTYAVAPWLRNAEDEDVPVTRPLTELQAAVGFSPFAFDARVRPYGEIGFAARVMHSGGVVALDPIAPFVYRAAVGFEVKTRFGWLFFADYGPQILDVHSADQATVEAMLSTAGERQGGYVYEPTWDGIFDAILVDMVGFRVGLRWYR